jgi:hypothetical protein
MGGFEVFECSVGNQKGSPMNSAESMRLYEAACLLPDTVWAVTARLGSRKLAGLVLLAALLLVRFCVAAEDFSKTEAEFARDKGEFELLVLGPDRKPLPAALVELRGEPVPNADRIQSGTFVRKDESASFVKTDAEGRVQINMPAEPKHFTIVINNGGYGPYWAGWSSECRDDPIPARFTVELEGAVSIGGIVVDEQGKPVAGVSVRPEIFFKKPEGGEKWINVGVNVLTDKSGKWRYDSVASSISAVDVAINSPEFQPFRKLLIRREHAIRRDQEPTLIMQLQRGFAVTGKVTDESGQPIAGARVHTRFGDYPREAFTENDGAYQLKGCESGIAKLVVSAKGKATDMQQLDLSAEMEPVDFQMQPGGKVRVRVIDDQGNPVPQARNSFQQWRRTRLKPFEFEGVNQLANEQGIWEWNEAPLDGFKADICPPDGMHLGSQSLIASADEYVFRTHPALVISGRVIDAESKQPIKQFTVTPGNRVVVDNELRWSINDRFVARDGKFRLRHVRDFPAHLVLIEARGYQSLTSRDIFSDEGNVPLDVELHPVTTMEVTVLKPSGFPAAFAEIAVGIPGSRISLTSSGRATFDHTTTAKQIETDDAGRFRLDSPDTPFELIIVHGAGFAHVKAAPRDLPEKIELAPWARVKGTFRIGKDPAPKKILTIGSYLGHPEGNSAPTISYHDEIVTDENGRFNFSRVFPGKIQIGGRMTIFQEVGSEEVQSQRSTPVICRAGETTELDLGGTGRPVIGRLQPPAGFTGKLPWNLASIRAEIQLLTPPPIPVPADIRGDREKTAKWRREWQQSPAGKAWQEAHDATEKLRETSPTFSATVGPRGEFRIDEMSSGSYRMSVWVGGAERHFLQQFRFEIPPLEGDRSDEPLDLGDIPLDK